MVFLKKDLRWGQIWFVITLLLLFTPGNELPTITWFEKYYCDKIVHATIFGVLAFLFIYPRRKDEVELKNLWVFIVLMACLIYAIASEMIQHLFIPHRTGDILDFLADSVGALAVFLWFRTHNYEVLPWVVEGDTMKANPEYLKKKKPL
ncbi:MAG: VanZ family protein [Bacteroidetes bacterium]|nr:VanZ family protein [Bacteroidota bacterium]MBS1591758.1 VanZ family protein [Bacteroidota bacterium]